MPPDLYSNASYNNKAEVEVACHQPDKDGKDHVYRYSAAYDIKYPFNIDPKLFIKYPFRDGQCIEPAVPEIRVGEKETIDKSTTAEFFVTTGVLAFLYSLAAMLVYVLADNLYANAPIIPFFDLVATGVLTLFWFLGWCSWVAQWGNVKDFYYNLPGILCSDLPPIPDTHKYTLECNNIGDVRFSKMTISLIFGFANIVLWAGSSWFVFKETSFHTKTEMQASYINPESANHRQQQPSHMPTA